jgi:hypothetical protein
LWNHTVVHGVAPAAYRASDAAVTGASTSAPAVVAKPATVRYCPHFELTHTLHIHTLLRNQSLDCTLSLVSIL